MYPVSAGGVQVGGVRFGNVRVDLRVGSLPFPSASWYVMALRRHMAIIVIVDKTNVEIQTEGLEYQCVQDVMGVYTRVTAR